MTDFFIWFMQLNTFEIASRLCFIVSPEIDGSSLVNTKSALTSKLRNGFWLIISEKASDCSINIF